VYDVAFSPDGRRFLARGQNRIRVWDVGTRRPIGEPIPADPGALEAVGFSPDGEQLTVVRGERTLRLVNLPAPAGDRTATFPARVVRADFRPDGRFLLVSCEDGSVHLWDVASWQPTGTYSAPSQALVGLFAPDGERFLAPHWDRRLRVRRVPTTEPAGPIIEQTDPISAALFVPGCPLLATASDRDMRLWHVPTGRRVGPVLHVEQFPRWAPTLWWDGGGLVARARDRSLRRYPIAEPITEPPDRVELRAKVRTGMELREGNVRLLDQDTWAECRRALAGVPTGP
jgi:WD40 repeat protein